MTKEQKEILQAQLNREKTTIAELKQVYEQAAKDIEAKIQALSARTDMENLQTIIYQKQYQEALKSQVNNILEMLHANEFTTIQDYLTHCYTDGYVGVMYDIMAQGIPIIMPINQEQVVKALQTDSKISTTLYKRLGEDVNALKTSIRSELSRGIAQGLTWNQVASHIAKGMKSNYNKAYNNAIRIARTEGHRIQCQSAYDAQKVAQSKGADVVKQWDSTLDNRTRPHHRMLDGQLRELDDPFEVDGLQAMYPSGFGRASEDVNCRCALLQRARWALDDEELQTLKERAEYFKLDKTKDFDDFKKKYLQASEQERSSVQKINNKGTELQELEKQFSDMTEGYSYDDFINDFGSIEDGFEGASAEEIRKAKIIDKKIRELRSNTNGIKQPLKKAIRTRQESIEIFNNHGIRFKDMSTGSIPEEVLSKYADFVENFEATHPRYFAENKLNLQSVSILDDVKLKNGKAQGRYRNDNIGANGIEIKKPAMSTKFNDYYSRSDDYDVRLFAHEYGHYIADTMDYNKLGISYSDVVQDSINRYFDGDIFKKPRDLKECLSPYGSTSYQEAFAEAFAEAYTSEEPREFASIFKEELEKALASKGK